MQIVNRLSHPEEVGALWPRGYPRAEAVLVDAHGQSYWVVVVKVTADLLSGRPVELSRQQPLCWAEQWVALRGWFVPRDLVLERSGTSVLVSGALRSDEPTERLQGSVRIGEHERVLIAEARANEPGPRRRAAEVSLGHALRDGFDLRYEGDERPAAIFGLSELAEPRRSWRGTFDERWQREQAPLPPQDAEARAEDASDWVLARRPRGGEAIALAGFGAPRRGVLPKLPLRLRLMGKVHPLLMDVLRLDVDRNLSVITYRASLPIAAPHPLLRAELFAPVRRA